ncbi:hypothetical protein [Stackebrandtia nassauensis]|uniref:Uncharacterized protein n=1 Tax=Stackebrandtia nassauensis (strain DSM 44728 / CIP 108903 / NRRL B-16338 / NBRC 102104 / LLR-40K-21) TaxID=446470 RepID=D3Q8Q4_STANL|nr:hypothetical protein [Stackebrandtia nassauensis]ADD44496.1 hypothetical protein Snas_4855 [Stackebrandtia nassauensis DSM 44728]
MRTCFDIAEHEEYHAARDLLIRRCREWAAEHDRPSDDTIVMSALDSRHYGPDGRLTYWTPWHVRYFLLEWIPRYMDAESGELDRAPEVLRTMLRFITDYGLRDPRGAAPQDNEKAIDATAPSFAEAVDDTARFGVSKFWTRVARTHGVDVADPGAVSRFQEQVRAGEVEVDEELLTRLLADSSARQPLGEGRALAQLPVKLPSTLELGEAADASPVVIRLRGLVEWLGSEGRPVTGTGALRRPDARKLAQRLDIELADVPLYVAWSKRTRLARQYRGKLVPVAKSASLLDDPLTLWRRAFDTLGQIGPEVFRSVPGEDGSMLEFTYADVLPDVLNSLYSLPEPMPLLRLGETVWQYSCGVFFDLDSISAQHAAVERGLVNNDLERLWQVLEELGAAYRSHGVADAMFREDLTEFDPETGEPLSPFDPETTVRLAEDLVIPGELAELTDLGTWALRDRMLAEGREAGLVGELADCDAAEMLGVVTQHYPLETRVVEVSGWLKSNESSIETLVDVARATPLRSRAAAILQLLYDVDSGAPKLLRRMRSDPGIGPAALVCLVETGVLDMMDLTEPERQLLTAESSLRLMEMDGPEAIIKGLGELPGIDARAVLDRVMSSGHPDRRALDEFRCLVVEPMGRQGLANRPKPPPKPAPGRLGATRRARARRRGQS